MTCMPFGSLWIPVLVSAVAVFVVSAVLHMALKYHRADYKQLPDEEGVRAALGKVKIPPGLYMTPYCQDGADMKRPEMQEKFVKGPVALVVSMPSGAPNMGKHLGLWFGYCLLSSFVVAYIARHTLHAGEDKLHVLQITGAVAFCLYGLGNIVDSIWKAQPWSNTFRSLIDGVVYAMVTGLIFRVLWPAA